MAVCPHCNAELSVDTLAAADGLSCPACGAAVDGFLEDPGLSSLAGSPADATQHVGADSDSSLADSSLSRSDDQPSADLGDATIDSDPGLPPAVARSEVDETVALGHKTSEDDDSFELDFDSGDGELIEQEEEGPSASLDATIDLCAWARDDADFQAADDATVDLGGVSPSDDLMATADSDAPSDEGATIALDVDRPAQRTPSSREPDSDEPSSTNEATLAFDSERPSAGVETPSPLDITGLSSGQTMPRGPLGEGRASQSLRPGDSMLVGDESVRLRAFLLAQPSLTGDSGVDYAIEGEAGKGGMGVVYKARQQSLDRLVAIKQIKSDLGASDSDRNKFVSEAVITGQLEHPNIAPVHDLGLAGDGLPFYAMKFVEGEDWEDSIKDLSENENLGILIQVAQAIAFAHSKNILHRDLKPGNVRLGSFGEVLVMDWGLAARLDDGSEIQPAGTPIYMPPETALEYLDYAKAKVVGGKRLGSSRRRIPAGTYCDIYLLGALLFKIVTGRAPHRGKTTFECLRNAAKNDIIKVRRSSELLDIAYRAMATEPEDRYGSAIEFIDAIKAYQSHAQSILIAKRASQDLREAGRLIDEQAGDATELYALFSSAQNGYRNALDLWEGNRKAARRLEKSQRMFAQAAYGNGDYDLAVSLLAPENEEDAELRAAVLRAQRDRSTRLAWFRRLQYATAASLLVALAFIAYSFVLKQDAMSLGRQLAETETLIDKKQAEVDAKQREANDASQRARDQTELARQQQALAAAKTVEVERLEVEVEAKQKAAEAATQRAERSEQLAAAKQREADRAAAIAREQTAEATRQSYNAARGRLWATLVDAGMYAAWKELQQIDPAVAKIGADDPEWRYLVDAVEWRDEAVELVGERAADGPRQTRLAASPGGGWVVAATARGDRTELAVYQGAEALEPSTRFEVAVAAGPVAIDATGRFVAIGGDSLSVVDTSTRELIRVRTLAVEVAALAFHPSEPELLVGDRSSGVSRWRVASTGVVLVEREDQWHDVPIVAVGYSPDGSQRFSADGRGRFVVWRRGGDAGDDRVPLRHQGAGSPRVTSVALADDPAGRLAYGCDDGAVYELFGWWADDGDPAARDGGYAAASSERLGESHVGRVTSVTYAEGGSTVLSAGGDTVLVRRSPTLTSAQRKALAARRVERRYHDAPVLACVVAGESSACSSDDRGRVVRWRIDVAPDELVFQPESGRGAGVAALELNPEAQSLVVADQGGFVRAWDDLRRPADSQTRFVGHSDHREMRAWRVGGKDPLVVTVAADNRAVVWGESDGLLRRAIDLRGRTVVALDSRRGILYAASDGRPTEDGRGAVAYRLRDGHSQTLWEATARVAALSLVTGDLAGGATLAVGLRDGQVFLWGPGGGRIDLTPSSGRPHWRPITALTYDPASATLYSADRGGLVASWDVRRRRQPREAFIAGAEGLHPITRLLLWGADRLVAVRSSTNGLLPVVMDRGLTKVRGIPSLRGVLQMDIDPALDRPMGIRGAEQGSQIVAWTRDRGWQEVASWNQRFDSIRFDAGGCLAWRPGIVERYTREEGFPLVARIVSRAPATAVWSRSEGRGAAIAGMGTVTLWDSLDRQVVGRLPLSGSLLAACRGDRADRVVVGLQSEDRTGRLELWDANRQTLIRTLVDRTPSGRPVLAQGEGLVAGAYAETVLVVPLGGGASETVTPPAGSAPTVGLSLSADGRRLAAVTADGRAWFAEQGPGGDWQVSRLDRESITSVAIPAEADRLLVGVENGRVEVIELGLDRESLRSTRTLLSLPGHSDRVTSLQVTAWRQGRRLVSGDASGRVVVRSF